MVRQGSVFLALQLVLLHSIRPIEQVATLSPQDDHTLTALFPKLLRGLQHNVCHMRQTQGKQVHVISSILYRFEIFGAL